MAITGTEDSFEPTTLEQEMKANILIILGQSLSLHDLEMVAREWGIDPTIPLCQQKKRKEDKSHE